MDSWADFYAQIDKQLDEIRPERIGPGEKDWMEPVYGWARNHLPDESRAVRNLAIQCVNNREARATRKGNSYLREYGMGQRPLFWVEVGPLPCSVGKLRIRLDAATSEDYEDAARELEIKGKRNYDSVVVTALTMRDLAREARHQGFAIVSMVGDLAQRNGDDVDDDDDFDDGDDGAP